jgi:LysM repeat protein
MPEPEAPSPASSKNFLMQKVGPLPLVAWVGIGGVTVGGFLWWRNRQQAAAGQSTATSAAASVPSAGTSEELMAAGLYQPPDITYNTTPPSESPTATAAPTQPGIGPVPAAVAPPGAAPLPIVGGPLPAVHNPPSAPAATMSNAAPTKVLPKYITVTAWPTPTSTLWGISQKVGVPLSRIEALNPQIKNPNLIHAGESIRYA